MDRGKEEPGHGGDEPGVAGVGVPVGVACSELPARLASRWLLEDGCARLRGNRPRFY